ncbi:MAG: hypothetical protein PHN82_05430 [bacterium]|nr:hypothetical protein [bacterium]
MPTRLSFARPSGKTPLVAAVLTLGFLLSAASCSAGVMWTPDGVLVRGPDTAGTADVPTLASDGSGGAIASWWDNRNGANDIYAQKVDAGGSPAWVEDGVRLCGSGAAYGPIAVSDDAGGAIVVWVDYRSGWGNLYAQRVDRSGTPLWTADGVRLESVNAHAAGHHAGPDGLGGAIVTWVDVRAGYNDVYAQRIDASGSVLWGPGGVAVRGPYGENAYDPQITTDGAGGAIVTWRDIRSGYEIYVRRVDAAGNVLWTPGGVVLRSTGGYAWSPQIAADGSGGAIVAWQDLRSGVGDVYAQKVDSAGITQWTTNGVALRVIPGSHAHSPRIAPDGSGGAIACWDDARGGNLDVYAQKVDSAGVVQWDINGLALRQIPGSDTDAPKPVSDGAGGVIVSWGDSRSGNRDVYAQKVDAAGVAQWDAGGLALRQLTGSDAASSSSRIVTDGVHGAVVVWIDFRNVQGSVYMQRANDIVPPSVDTDPATSVGATEATLNGEITDTGDENADERGFRWREVGAPAWTEWTEAGSFGTGTFNHAITGLTEETTYEYQAMAHNSAGWADGDIVTFTTGTGPVPSPLTAGSVTGMRVELPRAGEGEGFKFIFALATDPTGTEMGSVWCGNNEFTAADSYPVGPVAVRITPGHVAIETAAGDRLLIKNAAGEEIPVYLPALVTVVEPVTLYVDVDGATYYDAALTEVASPAPDGRSVEVNFQPAPPPEPLRGYPLSFRGILGPCYPDEGEPLAEHWGPAGVKVYGW